MAKPPAAPRTQARTTDAVGDRRPDRGGVEPPENSKHAGRFDPALPQWIPPCLPKLVDRPPTSAGWIHEIKWDGYRISGYVANGKATIRTRNGHDWTARFPAIAAALLRLKLRSAVIDGEAVVLDARGRSNFAELQASLARGGGRAPVFYAFDLLFLEGADLRERPLAERRAALADVVGGDSGILLSEEYAGSGAEFFRIACEHQLEGIVSKRLDRPYRSGKTANWLKTKCVKSGVFLIIGFHPASGSARAGLASIEVATFEGEALRYAGGVGAGFSMAVAAALRLKLDRLLTPQCAIPGLKVKGAVWTAPDVEVEIAYRGLTTTGELRHASFKGVIEQI